MIPTGVFSLPRRLLRVASRLALISRTVMFTVAVHIVFVALFEGGGSMIATLLFGVICCRTVAPCLATRAKCRCINRLSVPAATDQFFVAVRFGQ